MPGLPMNTVFPRFPAAAVITRGIVLTGAIVPNFGLLQSLIETVQGSGICITVIPDSAATSMTRDAVYRFAVLRIDYPVILGILGVCFDQFPDGDFFNDNL